MEAIANLWSGRAGLAKTYWIYGLGAGLLWGIGLSFIRPGTVVAIVAMLAFSAYFIVVNIGMWRAASQYVGPRIWAALAKVAVVLGFFTIAGVLAAIGSVARDSATQVVQPAPTVEQRAQPVPQQQPAAVPAAQQQAPASDDEWWKKGSTLVR